MSPELREATIDLHTLCSHKLEIPLLTSIYDGTRKGRGLMKESAEPLTYLCIFALSQ